MRTVSDAGSVRVILTCEVSASAIIINMTSYWRGTYLGEGAVLSHGAVEETGKTTLDNCSSNQLSHKVKNIHTPSATTRDPDP